jgi:methionyl aminopeptidase
MPISLKSDEAVNGIARAGRLVRRALDRVAELAAPGITTGELSAEAECVGLMEDAGFPLRGEEGRRGLEPFPAPCQVSVNEEVTHGIPSDRELVDGDIVTVDVGMHIGGWCARAAESFVIGQAPKETHKISAVAHEALVRAIAAMTRWARWSQARRVMDDYIQGEGLHLVDNQGGHGIGSEFWEEPDVPNTMNPRQQLHDFVLAPGTVVVVSPVVTSGDSAIAHATYRWPSHTTGGTPVAQFSHTVLITDKGPRILTDGSYVASDAF